MSSSPGLLQGGGGCGAGPAGTLAGSRDAPPSAAGAVDCSPAHGAGVGAAMRHPAAAPRPRGADAPARRQSCRRGAASDAAVGTNAQSRARVPSYGHMAHRAQLRRLLHAALQPARSRGAASCAAPLEVPPSAAAAPLASTAAQRPRAQPPRPRRDAVDAALGVLTRQLRVDPHEFSGARAAQPPRLVAVPLEAHAAARRSAAPRRAPQ
jgi:hypothetical protein